MPTRFYDRSAVTKAKLLDNGFLRAPATISRTGIYRYEPVGAKPFTVLRTESEVFSDASVESFALCPLTNDHPPGGEVNAGNAKALSVGSVGKPFRDGQDLCAVVMVTDAETIKRVQAGKIELSCGYWADLKKAPAGSVHTDGTPFDFYQTNITGNHLALVDTGRAGNSKLHLDAGDCVQTVHASHKDSKQMIITLDGLPFEVTDLVAAAIAKERAAAAAQLATAQGETAKIKTTLDAAEGQRDASTVQVKSLTEKIAKLEDPKHIAALIAERVAVEKLATEHGITADGLDSIGVKRAVVAKLAPDLKLDGKSNDYVEATFDALNRQPKNPVTDAAARAIAADPKVLPMASAEDKRKSYNASVFAADAAAVKK